MILYANLALFFIALYLSMTFVTSFAIQIVKLAKDGVFHIPITHGLLVALSWAGFYYLSMIQ